MKGDAIHHSPNDFKFHDKLKYYKVKISEKQSISSSAMIIMYALLRENETVQKLRVLIRLSSTVVPFYLCKKQ